MRVNIFSCIDYVLVRQIMHEFIRRLGVRHAVCGANTTRITGKNHERVACERREVRAREQDKRMQKSYWENSGDK